MKKTIPYLFLIIFSSCATIRLDKTYKLNVESEEVSKIKYNDSIYNLPTKITVNRSKVPLILTYITDSVNKEITIKRKLHPNFIYGNLPTYFIGYFIDLTNPKRFYYGNTIMLNVKDSVKVIREPLFGKNSKAKEENYNLLSKKFINKKGDFKILMSVPLAVNFEMKPENEGIKKSVGWGFTIGANYFYKENKFLSFNFTAITDRLILHHCCDTIPYQYEKSTSFNYSISDNFKINRFVLGYGLNFANNSYRFSKGEDFGTYRQITYKYRNNYNLGFVFTGYFEVFKYFSIGLAYRPTILQTYPSTKFLYQHTFGIDYQIKFN